MYLPKNDATKFVLTPAGTHLAVCYRVIDLGTQQKTYPGKPPKYERTVLINWELPQELMEDKRPFSVGQKYNFSMNEKANLRKHLEAWRGVPFKDTDFGPGGFQLEKILGKGCLLTIVHAVKGDNTYANIASVSGLPKGMVAPAPVNPLLSLDLGPEGDATFAAVFAQLSQKLQEQIMASPEYMEGQKRRGGGGSHADGAAENPADGMSDDIPFVSPFDLSTGPVFGR